MPLSLEMPNDEADVPQVDESEIVLPRRLDSQYAATLKKTLLERRKGPLELRAEDVEVLGMQCAVILVSAAKTWRADGATLTTKNPSDAFHRDLELMGLRSEDVSAS